MEDPTRWVATLNNDEVIKQEPGFGVESHWTRLKNHCLDNQLSITKLHIEFRDHIESPLPENARGYFFSYSADAMLNFDRTIICYILGYVDEQESIVHTYKFMTPELIVVETDRRNLDENSPSIIMRNIENGEGKK